MDYHDDFVPVFELGGHGEGGTRLESVPLIYEELGGYDCVVVVTNHTYLDAEALMANAQCVVDTRNLTGRAGSAHAKVVKL